MKKEKRQTIQEAPLYRRLIGIQKVMDQYYLDGVLGLLPYGIGDIIAALFAAVYAWFAITKVKSIPLTLAIANNALRDVVLGMIPFYIGDIIDFFHKANRQNMVLVQGFVNGDQNIIREVNKKALQSTIFIVVFLILIALLLALLIKITAWMVAQLGLLFS